MTKKLDEKSFEATMMKEFQDLRLLAGIRVPQDPEAAAYQGYRAGRMVSKTATPMDDQGIVSTDDRRRYHVVE
jgi:hypothetical protein